MFDIMIIGQITLDHNIDFDGREEYRTGGAVTFSGYAAAAIGHRVAVVPKGDPQRVDPFATFQGSKVEKVFPVFSPTCTEMENRYFTPDRERRRSLNTQGIVCIFFFFFESHSVVSESLQPRGLQSMDFSRPEYWSG